MTNADKETIKAMQETVQELHDTINKLREAVICEHREVLKMQELIKELK